MIFSNKIYPKPVAELILSGKKTCTRRLVKEGEYLVKLIKDNKILSVEHWGRIKWQVGRDVSVQLGRGKYGLYCCLKCGFNWQMSKAKLGKYGSLVMCLTCAEKKKVSYLEPLRIKITGIRKERLQNIQESDAKKEGFEGIETFLDAFYSLNSPVKKLSNGKFEMKDLEVWVLDFSVKK